ncbi:hypothetical protein CMK18_11320 [Candidatus Poribacteria bacterium]|nr:hypothetical protein [Candidatus Poribacteria bacterium]
MLISVHSLSLGDFFNPIFTKSLSWFLEFCLTADQIKQYSLGQKFAVVFSVDFAPSAALPNISGIVNA